MEEFERLYVAARRHGGWLTVAAKHADMGPKNFSEKMARYGLRRPPSAEGSARPGGASA